MSGQQVNHYTNLSEVLLSKTLQTLTSWQQTANFATLEKPFLKRSNMHFNTLLLLLTVLTHHMSEKGVK